MITTVRIILCGFIFGCFLLSMERAYREYYLFPHQMAQCALNGGEPHGSICVYN
jgi:hypothetical protein